MICHLIWYMICHLIWYMICHMNHFSLFCHLSLPEKVYTWATIFIIFIELFSLLDNPLVTFCEGWGANARSVKDLLASLSSSMFNVIYYVTKLFKFNYMCAYLHIFIYICVCVCVCVFVYACMCMHVELWRVWAYIPMDM